MVPTIVTAGKITVNPEACALGSQGNTPLSAASDPMSLRLLRVTRGLCSVHEKAQHGLEAIARAIPTPHVKIMTKPPLRQSFNSFSSPIH